VGVVAVPYCEQGRGFVSVVGQKFLFKKGTQHCLFNGGTANGTGEEWGVKKGMFQFIRIEPVMWNSYKLNVLVAKMNVN